MAAPAPRRWTIHLAAVHPKHALLVVLVIVLTLSTVMLLIPPNAGVGGRVLFLALALLLLLGATGEFLFPVTYQLDAEGAHARFLGSHRVLAWGRVQRVYVYPDGIKLSPLAAPGFLETYRGVRLRTPERDAVLADVRAWLAEAGVSPTVVEDTSC